MRVRMTVEKLATRARTDTGAAFSVGSVRGVA
ncbi:hypothetical protein SAFG77S_02445 [Streptomyces afghaniensis]